MGIRGGVSSPRFVSIWRRPNAKKKSVLNCRTKIRSSFVTYSGQYLIVSQFGLSVNHQTNWVFLIIDLDDVIKNISPY